MTPQEVLEKMKRATHGMAPGVRITYKSPIALKAKNPGGHNQADCYKLTTDSLAVKVRTNKTSEYRDKIAQGGAPASTAPKGYHFPTNPEEEGYFWYLDSTNQPYVRSMLAKGFGPMQTIKYFIDGQEVTLQDLDNMYANGEIASGYKPRPINGLFANPIPVHRIVDVEVIKDTNAAKKAAEQAAFEKAWEASHTQEEEEQNESLNESAQTFTYTASVEKRIVYVANIQSDVQLSDDEVLDKLIEAIDDGDAYEKDADYYDFTVDDVKMDEAEDYEDEDEEDEDGEFEESLCSETTNKLLNESKKLEEGMFYKYNISIKKPFLFTYECSSDNELSPDELEEMLTEKVRDAWAGGQENELHWEQSDDAAYDFSIDDKEAIETDSFDIDDEYTGA